MTWNACNTLQKKGSEKGTIPQNNFNNDYVVSKIFLF